MFARPRRQAATINISELSNAKGSILVACANMHTGLVKIDKDLIADLKRRKAEDDEPDSEKSCKAEIFEGDTNLSATGEYDSAESIHAELNALTSYISQKTDFSNITKIRITSPPCKSCAFVLRLLGLLDKVHTTKGIYKEFTGSWVWPKALQNSGLFSAVEWDWVREQFEKTGVDEQKIIACMVTVIQNKNAY